MLRSVSDVMKMVVAFVRKEPMKPPVDGKVAPANRLAALRAELAKLQMVNFALRGVESTSSESGWLSRRNARNCFEEAAKKYVGMCEPARA
ncbi:MAG: hypothetical protein V1492_00215 [Candidatus Micrarchaeota archaeon]